MIKYKRGLYVGRFQPFHFGHLEVIKKLIGNVEELIIVVGSPQKSHELKNPFTLGERIRMIRSALDDEQISQKKYYIIPVLDLDDHSSWVSHVKAWCPPFNIVYSNDPLTLRLFKEARFLIENIPFISRDKYSASEVRKRMLNDAKWKELLPKTTIKIIEEIEGVDRLKEIAGKDYSPND